MEESVDKAQWKRFGSKAERCRVCGKPGQVNVKLTAIALTGVKGGIQLAALTVLLCEEHALTRFQNADKALHA